MTLELFAQYGIQGLVIFAGGWFILYRDRSHSQERKELQDSLKQQHTEALESSRENREVMKGVVVALTEVSTIIKRSK